MKSEKGINVQRHESTKPSVLKGKPMIYHRYFLIVLAIFFIQSTSFAAQSANPDPRTITLTGTVIVLDSAFTYQGIVLWGTRPGEDIPYRQFRIYGTYSLVIYHTVQGSDNPPVGFSVSASIVTNNTVNIGRATSYFLDQSTFGVTASGLLYGTSGLFPMTGSFPYTVSSALSNITTNAPTYQVINNVDTSVTQSGTLQQ